eukprot:113107_1
MAESRLPINVSDASTNDNIINMSKNKTITTANEIELSQHIVKGAGQILNKQNEIPPSIGVKRVNRQAAVGQPVQKKRKIKRIGAQIKSTVDLKYFKEWRQQQLDENGNVKPEILNKDERINTFIKAAMKTGWKGCEDIRLLQLFALAVRDNIGISAPHFKEEYEIFQKGYLTQSTVRKILENATNMENGIFGSATWVRLYVMFMKIMMGEEWFDKYFKFAKATKRWWGHQMKNPSAWHDPSWCKHFKKAHSGFKSDQNLQKLKDGTMLSDLWTGNYSDCKDQQEFERIRNAGKKSTKQNKIKKIPKKPTKSSAEIKPINTTTPSDQSPMHSIPIPNINNITTTQSMPSVEHMPLPQPQYLQQESNQLSSEMQQMQQIQQLQMLGMVQMQKMQQMQDNNNNNNTQVTQVTQPIPLSHYLNYCQQPIPTHNNNNHTPIPIPMIPNMNNNDNNNIIAPNMNNMSN